MLSNWRTVGLSGRFVPHGITLLSVIIADLERRSPKICSVQENECGMDGVRTEIGSELTIP